MDKTDQNAAGTGELLIDMVVNLESALNRLREQVQSIGDSLGEERVAELFEFWSAEDLSIEVFSEFLSRATDRERMLIRLWNRLERLGELRARAGRSIMSREIGTAASPKIADGDGAT